MAKPKLALIPATIGTKVYSVLPSDGDGDFAFTRTTVGTRINSLGLIEEVDSGKNRLNYDLLDGKVYGCPHLLLEPSRTNYLHNSQTFLGFVFQGSTFLQNQTISPDGTLNAGKLIENTNNERHSAFKVTASITSTSNTVSVFLKKETRRYASIVTSDTTNWNTMVVVDLELGIITSTFNKSGFTSVNKIENYGNGWYRVTSSITGSYTGNELYSRFGIQNIGTPSPPPSNNYQGDGTSGIYIWGAQLEQGSYPTSYIKTTGSAVTRNAETAFGSGTAQTFNDSEGVLMAEISALADDGTERNLSLSNGTTSNRISWWLTATDTLAVAVYSGGVLQYFTNFSIGISRNFNKISFQYKLNNFKLWINGFERATDTSGITPIGLSELAFDRADGALDFYGNVKQVQYFDTALANTELEELTSWVSFQEMANGQLYTIE